MGCVLSEVMISRSCVSLNQAVAAWNNQFFSSLTCKIRKLVRHEVILFYNIPIYTNVYNHSCSCPARSTLE